MKKRIIATLIVVSLVITGAYAASGYKQNITVDYGINLSIDGQVPTLTDVNGKVVQPFAYNGTTYVPIRAVTNNLGGSVFYDAATNTAVIESPNQNNAYLNKCIDMMGFYTCLSGSYDFLFDNLYMLSYVVTENNRDFYDFENEDYGTVFLSLVETMEKNRINVEDHYEFCKDYLTSSDIELVEQYRRLNEITLTYLEAVHNFNAPLSSVQLPASQAQTDFLPYYEQAQNKFWETYHSAYEE